MAGTPSVATTKFVIASDMPTFQFGYFLVSQNGFGFGPVPGSAGTYCLIGGPVGRYNQPLEIFDTGANGLASLSINPNAMRTPTGDVQAMAGTTWNFQAWHRENGGSSNFTNAMSLLME